MDVRLLFPADYLSAAWLRGRDVTLTISQVIVDTLRTEKGSEKKPVMQFRELDAKRARGETCPFKLVLNRTNAKTIAKALGTHEIEEWVGRRITLYGTTCLAFGAQVECVRVREKEGAPAKTKARQPEPEPMEAPVPTDDEIAEEEVA